jgi:processive 1,2-diacylglycerol beta-glucosyltransferase
MKLLASYNLTEARKDKTISPVELWRIKRPTNQLKLETDWEIDETTGIFPEARKAKAVTEVEMQKRLDYFKKYDLVWGSYYTNPFIHTFTMIAQEKMKTKFIMDCDDNVFEIDPLNPIHVAVKKKYLEFLKGIVVDTKYMTTTTEVLADKLREMRSYRDPDTVKVIPNMISTAVYKPWKGDNGDKIVIGYAGGSSHYADLHYTGMYDALVKIMHEYKNVYVVTAGMFFDKYLPKARYKFIYGERGEENWYKTYSKLNFDIAIAPLEDSRFTVCKSNIKWQEYGLMGIPTLASNVGPYKDTIKHGSDGYLIENTMEAWYNAFKLFIENKQMRKKIGAKAKERVINEFSIEKNWQKIQETLESFQAL